MKTKDGRKKYDATEAARALGVHVRVMRGLFAHKNGVRARRGRNGRKYIDGHQLESLRRKYRAKGKPTLRTFAPEVYRKQLDYWREWYYGGDAPSRESVRTRAHKERQHWVMRADFNEQRGLFEEVRRLREKKGMTMRAVLVDAIKMWVLDQHGR